MSTVGARAHAAHPATSVEPPDLESCGVARRINRRKLVDYRTWMILTQRTPFCRASLAAAFKVFWVVVTSNGGFISVVLQ
jgi:hypothetical protein